MPDDMICTVFIGEENVFEEDGGIDIRLDYLTLSEAYQVAALLVKGRPSLDVVIRFNFKNN